MRSSFVTPASLICRILAKFSDPKKEGSSLVLIDPESGEARHVPIPYPTIGSLSVVETENKVLLTSIGRSPKRPSVVAAIEVSSLEELLSAKPSQWIVLKEGSKMKVRLSDQLIT